MRDSWSSFLFTLESRQSRVNVLLSAWLHAIRLFSQFGAITIFLVSLPQEIPTASQSSQEKETAILRPAVPQSVPSTSTAYDLPEPLENMQQVGKGKNTDVSTRISSYLNPRVNYSPPYTLGRGSFL